MGPTQAPDVYLLDLAADAPPGRSRTSTRTSGSSTGGGQEVITWRAAQPHRNALMVYLPSQVLAAAGYAVLAPNYRGGTGRGHACAVSNRRALGGGDITPEGLQVGDLLIAGAAVEVAAAATLTLAFAAPAGEWDLQAGAFPPLRVETPGSDGR